MENNKRISDNELKISINKLKKEINESNISFDTARDYKQELDSNIAKRMLSIIAIIVLVLSMLFVSYPVVPGIIAIFIHFNKRKIDRKIIELKEKVEKSFAIECINSAQLILKDNELEVRETVLDYRNGKELSSNKINNLNIFGFLVPEIEYDIKEINDKYNYKFDERIIEEQGWRFIPASQMNDEKDIELNNQKVLKR